jgi:hypothetical protein
VKAKDYKVCDTHTSVAASLLLQFLLVLAGV